MTTKYPTKEIVGVAFEHYNSVKDFCIPGYVTLSKDWYDIQTKLRGLIPIFDNPIHAIWYAQDHTKTSINHRAKAVAHDLLHRMAILETMYPEFDLSTSPLCDSPYSRPDTIMSIDDKRLSNIFFWHLMPYLGICRITKKLDTILEIGGGMGEFARLLKLGQPQAHWLDIDMPEMLFFAECYLRSHFPDASFKYLSSIDPIDVEDADFNFVPFQFARLVGGHFDLALSQGSMQEMQESMIDAYISLINDLDVDHFYSLNYKTTPFHWPENWAKILEVDKPWLISDCSVDYEIGFRITR